jgi:hypothetical protein
VAVAAVLAAAAGLLAAGSLLRGDPPAPARTPARAAGPAGVAMIGGEKLQSARCRQWRGATRAEKDAVVDTLERVVGGPTPYGQASILPDRAAHELFDRACARYYARGFLLYEMYTRAAAFHETPQRDL